VAAVPKASRLTARTRVLAHGAGTPMNSPFINSMAEGIGGAEVGVMRFEFAYMAARRFNGKRHALDRAAVLIEVMTLKRVGGPSNSPRTARRSDINLNRHCMVPFPCTRTLRGE